MKTSYKETSEVRRMSTKDLQYLRSIQKWLSKWRLS